MTTVPLFLDPPEPDARPRVSRDELSHLAHELNNLLAVIMGHADCLDITLPEHLTDRTSVAAIRQAAQAASDVVARVREAGRPASLVAPAATSVAPVVRAAGRALAARLQDRLTVAVHPAPRLWTASVDAALLDDALMAVVGEAAASVPHGATVRIRAANAEVGANRPHLVGSVRRERYVRVEVAVPEAAGRLRFVAPGKAAPASAADVCLAALAAAGARVSVDSDGVCASLISLLLPSDGIEAREAQNGDDAADATQALRTIVVLDGDGARRALLHKILRAQRHHVLPVASEADVVALPEGTSIDLVIADRPVAWPAGAEAGHPPVIYTGRAGLPDGAFGPCAVVRALPTPFGAPQLVSAVRSMLGTARDGAAAAPAPFKSAALEPNHIADLA